jgi:spermidine synthase
MIEQSLDQAISFSPSRRFLLLLLVLFIASGCAALIYEIVWLQLLEFVIGSSAVSLGVLLGTYMGGMCLGSIALPRIISRRGHPLRVYALFELGIGMSGIVILFGMPSVVRFYTANLGHGLPGILLRGAVSAVCLLLPTMLMGATLPAISRWIEMTPQGVSWLGFLYAANTIGAVFGCLLAGFYLLRVHDMGAATYVAAAVNGSITLVALVLAALTPYRVPVGNPGQGRAVLAPGFWSVYIAIALSGLSALGAEVIWTRLLSLMLGATVYTFSIILAVFLAGLGIGSSLGSFLARKTLRPRIALGCCQMLLAAAICWSAVMIAKSLPFWPINPSLSKSPWLNFQVDLLRCLWAILPAAVLWGASFPLALRAVASRGQDPGRLVGGIYAANTVGAIIGAIGFSMIFIPWAGTQQSQRLLIGLSAAAALLMFAPLLRQFREKESTTIEAAEPKLRKASALVLPGSILVAALLAWSVPEVPWKLIAYGRYLPTKTEEESVLYVGEGMNASVAVTELKSGTRIFHVSGRVEASSEGQDMRMERMLGHFPALIHPRPRSVLVVGCGAGVTAGSFVLYPDVERIVICEIEPMISKVVARYFSDENYDVLDDPRVTVVVDDARHYILTTQESFDIITSDPIHPWIKGSAVLYTKEYFELCKRHLNPGGVIAQWVPLYESTFDTVKSELATFFAVFPHGTIWSNDFIGLGYDLLLLAQAKATKINVDEFQKRLDSDGLRSVAESLREVGFKSALGLLATYAGQGPDLEAWLEGAEINRDRNLRLQYLAGLGLNSYESWNIYEDLLAHYKFPQELFVASPELKQELRRALGGDK